ncbi:MAG: response regulator, partial [Cyanobacteria bacterium J06628_4]
MGLALVVDDSKTILEMLTKCLAQDGLTVITAANGADALAQLSAQIPDIIVLDV